MPPADLLLWEKLDLPFAPGNLLPMASRRGMGELERPDARRLAFLEGLLAALAETSEEEMDAGSWEKQVPTFRGPLSIRLRLPLLSGPEEEVGAVGPGKRSQEKASARARALRLADAAWDARGRRQIQLARQAIELWPDCSEALVILGDRAPDREAACALYARAVAAAERMLGPETFRDEAEISGVCTRPAPTRTPACSSPRPSARSAGTRRLRGISRSSCA
ncbi:MAG TPA: hypothetical protein VOA87_01115 [Thermoanaerobaculia bacterium]|nr:hypothetical protein [Thermoanaerobaculia bacterium]